ncbi:MAG: hypothetical protein WCO81_05010 [Cyanobacteriota bacterium ELA615]|jgi:hypothetical protein
MTKCNLANALLKAKETQNLLEEYDKYYRINLATSLLCNRCDLSDRARILAEIDAIFELGLIERKDILDIYAQICDGKVETWINQHYGEIFQLAM